MKVIIIGSGISGLSAASTLVEAGVNEFLILEARDRVGGRIAQAKEFEDGIDLGASWIHGVTDNPLTAIAEELNLKLDVTNNPNLTGEDGFEMFGPDGKLINPEVERNTRVKFDMLFEKAREFLIEKRGGIGRRSTNVSSPPSTTSVLDVVSTSAASGPSISNPIRERAIHDNAAVAADISDTSNDATFLRDGSMDGIDHSVGELLLQAEQYIQQPLNEEERRLMNWMKSGIEGWENTNLNQLSGKFHSFEPDETCFTGGDGFMMDGYYKITNFLFSKIGGPQKVKFNSPVASIDYTESVHQLDNIHEDAPDFAENEVDEIIAHATNVAKRFNQNATASSRPGKVKVTTVHGEQYEADHVICTVPLGVLKSNTIQFIPALPKPKQAAIDRLGFGLMNKIILQFPETFWNTETEGFGYVSNHHGEFSFFMNLHLLTKKPILVCFIAADFAYEVEEWDDATILNRIMLVLNKMYGKEGKPIPNPVISRITRWGSDPFARGSYTFMKTHCSYSDIRNLAKPIGGLHFAGEATFKRVGYVHGGFISGQKEALKIIASLKASTPKKSSTFTPPFVTSKL